MGSRGIAIGWVQEGSCCLYGALKQTHGKAILLHGGGTESLVCGGAVLHRDAGQFPPVSP